MVTGWVGRVNYSAASSFARGLEGSARMHDLLLSCISFVVVKACSQERRGHSMHVCAMMHGISFKLHAQAVTKQFSHNFYMPKASLSTCKV